MNIQTVAENLRKTIAGKEKYLAEIRQARLNATNEQDIAWFASSEMLKINIAELERVLQDVEQCEQFDNYEKWDGDE